MGHAAPAALGVYKPRRPQVSPLFRLVQDHLHRLQTVYDERFAHEYGPWRPVIAQVTDTFLACGILEHGFARIRCDACAHEYLLAFSGKCRYFCPSGHAKRLAIWAQWLDTTLLAPVPHEISVPMVVAPKLAPTEATRRWAALLRQIYEVDPLVCPRCAGAMRLVACITQSAVIDQILAHLRTRAAARGVRRQPPAIPASLHAP